MWARREKQKLATDFYLGCLILEAVDMQSQKHSLKENLSKTPEIFKPTKPFQKHGVRYLSSMSHQISFIPSIFLNFKMSGSTVSLLKYLSVKTGKGWNSTDKGLSEKAYAML